MPDETHCLSCGREVGWRPGHPGHDAACRRYGHPPNTTLTLDQQIEAEKSVTCPVCGRGPGSWCVRLVASGTGSPMERAHAARRDIALAVPSPAVPSEGREHAR